MRRKLLTVFVLLLSAAGMSLAQAVDSQQIFGTVTDPTGAAVPNADIVVTNEATGIARSVKSNNDGNYVVLNVPVGKYTVATTAPGFKKSVLAGVNVDIGAKPEVPIALSVGQATESVEVQADMVMIQTTTAEIGGVITSTEATQIQLNGRNYVQLLTLQPGVSTTVASGFNIFGTYGVNGNSQSVNGIRSDSANYFIDGVDNKDNGGGGNNFVNISPDSLQQFRNVASSYDASYGGTSGATVSVAIKSGGRDFHGSAYEHIRNDAIQAYPYRFLTQTSAPVKAPLRYNDFGWTLGGPIWIPGHFNQNREKLFFFAAQEFKRLRNSTATIVAVPTPTQMSNAIAAGSTATGRALAATVLTDPSGSYNYLSLNNNNQSEYLVKIDYSLNEKNQISGRFVHDNVFNIGNPTNFVIYDRTIPGLTSSVSWTHTFSPKVVNVATGSYSGNIINEGGNIRANPQFRGAKILRSDFGLSYPTLYSASNIIPQITITGFSNPGVTPRQFDNSQRIYALKDDVSMVFGNHSIKTGAYFWRARKNQTAPPALNGQFNFTSLTNLVNGNFASYTEGSNIPQVQARFLQFETYVQDDWTVSRRLTVNLGLRWQLMPPIFSWPNNTAFFDPTLFDPSKAATIGANGSITSNPSPYNGLVLPGSGFSDKAKQVVAPSVYNNPAVLALFRGRPGGIVPTKYNTFAPRVGFAYDLSGKQTTVLHGGYGMSYERVQGNYIYGATSQLPFTAVASLASAGNADNLGSIGTAATPTNISNSAAMNLEPPRIHNYSIGVQHKLFDNTSVELNYVGSRSTNLTYRKNLNQGAAGTEQANPTVTQRNALRPYRGYGEIYQYTNGAHSNYNSLQFRMQTRFKQGGLATISYTWSKSLTMGSSFDYQPQDSLNLAADYGPASFNQPKIFVASYVYPLPFWHNQPQLYKRILGDWQVSGMTRIANGLPINVIQASGLSVAGNLVTTANVAQRPNLVGNPYARNGKQYLNAAAFATPAAGTYGNLGYDAIKGPLFNNWDAALQKNFTFHEQVGMEFRAEMFDVPNHMSMFTIANTLGASTFGQVTSSTGATDPRTMEFVLRLHF